MKKIYMLLFLIVFVTGCTLNYDVKIYDDESVLEKFSLEINNDLFGSTKTEIKKNLEEEIEVYKESDILKDYNFSYKIDEETTKIFVEKNHLNLTEFFDSYFIKNVFVKSNFIRNKDLMTFKLKNYDDTLFYGYRTESDEKVVLTDKDIREVKINLYFERKVTSHNAIDFNEKENKYTWEYYPNQEYSDIEIVYTDEKRYDIIIKNLILKNLNSVIPIFIFSVIVLFIIIKNIIKINKNKKI